MAGSNRGGDSDSSSSNQQVVGSESSPMHLSYSRGPLVGTKRKYLEAAIGTACRTLEGNKKMVEEARKGLKIDDDAAKSVHQGLEKKLEQTQVNHPELEKLGLIKHIDELTLKSIEEYGDLISTLLKRAVESMSSRMNEDTN